MQQRCILSYIETGCAFGIMEVCISLSFRLRWRMMKTILGLMAISMLLWLLETQQKVVHKSIKLENLVLDLRRCSNTPLRRTYMTTTFPSTSRI